MEPAWDALLSTQEQVRLQKLSLTPPFLRATVFLESMAELALEDSTIATGWEPVLAEL